MPSRLLRRPLLAVVLSFSLLPNRAHASADVAPALQQLSAQFWQWRATEQPFSDDDIPRLDRPVGFVAHWSAADVEAYEQRIADFEKRWRALDGKSEPVSVQVDYRLLGSAIARVHWELEVTAEWRRSPFFYVNQGLGATYTLLLQHVPMTPERQREVIARLGSVPRLLNEGRDNLTDMRQPYATVAMENLDGIEGRMERFRAGIHQAGGFSPENLSGFDAAAADASRSLVRFREWLRPQVAALPKQTAVGREGYLYFLRNVALLSWTPEQMESTGEAEFARAVSFESLDRAANTGLPQVPVYPSLEAQIADEQRQERAIRAYLVQHGVLSEPAGVRQYNYLPLPPYLEALSFLGVPDDLTGPERLNEDGSSYKRTPAAEMPFFDAITARDVRPLTIHEGVPGHYYQLAWSWHHPDPIRRHYYDSQSNEGIGFYAEEMMLEAGLFDHDPPRGAKTREAIYSMMRLRALRVVVDVKLALGEFTLAQAAEYLRRTVPMDAETARDEAAAFATTPGQAITYQIGKSDILRLLKDARERQGESFSLQRFHDSLWLNGNVPFSLQRWQMLGDSTDVPPIPPSFAWRP